MRNVFHEFYILTSLWAFSKRLYQNSILLETLKKLLVIKDRVFAIRQVENARKGL